MYNVLCCCTHHYTIQQITLAFFHVAKQWEGAYMNNIIVLRRKKGKRRGKRESKERERGGRQERGEEEGGKKL